MQDTEEGVAIDQARAEGCSRTVEALEKYFGLVRLATCIGGHYCSPGVLESIRIS